MYHDYTYEAVLKSSLRAQWELDDVLRADQELDFSRNFLPDSIARTAELTFLSEDERRTLNQISAHQYLHLFGVVEEFVLPFVMDHARPMLNADDYRVRALLNFASEEAKHIHLFNRFHEAFVRGFPVTCTMVGPREVLGKRVLAHHPLSVALVVLMIEWMTQAHYVGSVKDDGDIDPLFKSLLKHHWMEEAQHAKIDTLIVDALAEGRSEAEIDQAMNGFFSICRIFDGSLEVQAKLNVDALERAIGRRLPERHVLAKQQHAASRWTFIGLGLVHERFNATLRNISSRAAARVAAVVAHESGGSVAVPASAGTA